MPPTDVAAVPRTSLGEVKDFLAHKRIALVGLSRDPRDFSHMVMREFLARGYDVAPVNPAATEIEGRPCFARVQDIEPRVTATLVMTTPTVAEQVVRDCADAGISQVWLHRAGGEGAVSPAAVAFCREHHINVVSGECPLMFLPGTAWFHRCHGWVKKLFGSYPR